MEETSKPGKGWHGDHERHVKAGSKGGITTSRDQTHMQEIGRKGGLSIARNREHMVEIGRKGGLARSKKKAEEKNAHLEGLDGRTAG